MIVLIIFENRHNGHFETKTVSKCPKPIVSKCPDMGLELSKTENWQ